MTDDKSGPLYHLKDSFYFMRGTEGSINIYYGPGIHKGDGPDAGTNVTPSEFASAVAAVSARGETGETFHEAEELLTKELVHATG